MSFKNNGPGGCCCGTSCEVPITDHLFTADPDWHQVSPGSDVEWTIDWPITGTQSALSFGPAFNGGGSTSVEFTVEALSGDPILFFGSNFGQAVIDFKNNAAWVSNVSIRTKEQVALNIGAGPSYSCKMTLHVFTNPPGAGPFNEFEDRIWHLEVDGVSVGWIPQFTGGGLSFYAVDRAYGWEAWTCNDPFKPAVGGTGFLNINYHVLELVSDQVPKEDLISTGSMRIRFDKFEKFIEPPQVSQTCPMDSVFGLIGTQFYLDISGAAASEMNGLWRMVQTTGSTNHNGKKFTYSGAAFFLTSPPTDNGYTNRRFIGIDVYPYVVDKTSDSSPNSTRASEAWGYGAGLTIAFKWQLYGTTNSDYHYTWIHTDAEGRFVGSDLTFPINLTPAQIFSDEPIVSGGAGPLPVDPEGCEGLQYASRYNIWDNFLGNSTVFKIQSI